MMRIKSLAIAAIVILAAPVAAGCGGDDGKVTAGRPRRLSRQRHRPRPSRRPPVEP